ncbi:hypothetical protein TIFTF001_004533 [Ficus carica]|uniref:BHLH domain-containing protein n=1 Tax=Ficus carica TaxID=3494 RepID=A0AA88CTC2_FICCA|nr:hypothetical protein TIFTF001_004533 [Ficus carica]
MEDPTNFTCDKYQLMNSLDDQHYMTPLDELLNFQSFSSQESYATSPIFVPNMSENLICNSVPPESPVVEKLVSKQLKSSMASTSSSSQIITFENSNLGPNIEAAGSTGYLIFKSFHDETQSCAPNYEEEVMIKTRVGSMCSSTPSYSQEHVVAERKRREKLTQRFVALSAVIPGLKKLDKASVLEGAIKYVKDLEERVRTLEDQASKKTVESVVFAKRSLSSQIISTADHEDSVSLPDYRYHEMNLYSCSDQPLPEIEARVLNKDVLIRIHCEKQKGISCNLANILGEIEKHHLTVVNSSVMPLGSFTIDITVVAQMDVGFCMDAKELEKNLRETLLNYS